MIASFPFFIKDDVCLTKSNFKKIKYNVYNVKKVSYTDIDLLIIDPVISGNNRRLIFVADLFNRCIVRP